MGVSVLNFDTFDPDAAARFASQVQNQSQGAPAAPPANQSVAPPDFANMSTGSPAVPDAAAVASSSPPVTPPIAGVTPGTTIPEQGAAQPAAPAAPAGPGLSPQAQSLVDAADRVMGQLGHPTSMSQTTRNNSTTITPGRPLANVNAEIGREAAAGQNVDNAVLAHGQAQDQRAEAANVELQRGAQGSVERNTLAAEAAKREQEDAAARVSQLQADLKANDESMDPGHLVKSMSTGVKIGTTILAALSGAFAAALGQGNANPVLGAINKQIDTDIERQKAEISSGHIRIGNQISEFMRKGYDADAAEKLARDRIESGVQQLTQLESQRVGAAGSNADAAQLLTTQLGAQRQQRADDLLATTETKTQTSHGSVTETKETSGVQGGADALIKGIKADLDVHEMLRSGLTRPEFDAQAEKVATKAEKVQQLKAAALDAAKATGLTVTTDASGRQVLSGTPNSGSRIMGVGKVIPSFGTTDQRDAANNAFARLEEAGKGFLGKGQGERNFTFSNDASIVGQLQDVFDIANSAEQGITAGYSPFVVQAYKRASGQSSGAPTVGDAAPGVKVR